MSKCFVCGQSPTFYIARGKEYCGKHREEAVAEASRESVQRRSELGAERYRLEGGIERRRRVERP